MRGEEIKKGIDVYDTDGNTLGKSQKAAFQAVGEVSPSS